MKKFPSDRILLFVHGATYPAETAFDLPIEGVSMMDLIAGCGGNVSSEHGVGSRKRKYVSMSREPADIAAMRTLKAAFDPTGYLNAAVLFD